MRLGPGCGVVYGCTMRHMRPSIATVILAALCVAGCIAPSTAARAAGQRRACARRLAADQHLPALAAGVTVGPRLREPGCIIEKMVLSGKAPDLKPFNGYHRSPVSYAFLVSTDGRASDLHVITPGSVPESLSCAVWDAITTCEYEPAKDVAGLPIAAWLIYPVTFTVTSP